MKCRTTKRNVNGGLLAICFFFFFANNAVVARDDTTQVAGVSGIEKLLIRSACEDLLLGYGEALDSENLDAMVTLFAEDGIWGMEDKLSISGKDAIREFWEKLFSAERIASERHDISTVRMSATSATTASGSAYVTLYVLDLKQPENNTLLAPQFMVKVKVDCAKTDAGWKFKELNISPIAATTYNNRKAAK